jgi:glycosyltransferase involved in cell wall biosynthesis
MPPDVTVIIPTRNRWKLLRRTLGGVLRQEGISLEVIVVDDCSTDETALELARLTDPRVRVFRNAERRGVAAARNLALDAASGTWTAFLDDDDLWAPSKLHAVLDAARRTSGARWAYSAAAVVNEATEMLQLSPAPDPETIDEELLVRNAVPGGCSNVVAETSLVREVGGFDTELSLLADWDLWIRLALAAPAAASPEPLVAYVRHPGSMVARGRQQDVIREVDRLVAKYRTQAAERGVEPDLRVLYRYFARAHRRAGRRIPASRLYARVAVAYWSGGDALRAAGALFGEPVARLRRQLKRRTQASTRHDVPDPPWLELYRTSAGLGAGEQDVVDALGASNAR